MIHVPFPSIDQFRTTVKIVRDRAKYHGIPVPTLTFYGTVKLHGTNAGVVQKLSDTSTFWAQSRTNIITPEKDNAGFARFVKEHEDLFGGIFRVATSLLKEVSLPFDDPNATIGIYGEWCGKGIMKGVGISQVPRMFVIFGVNVTPSNASNNVDQGEEDPNNDYSVWFPPELIEELAICCGKMTLREHSIFTITSFKQWKIDIDFNSPELVQNQLGELTMEVEKECPVAKEFDVSGIGEGIVWKYYSGAPPTFAKVNDLIFKVKGEKHSDTKVKTLAAVDIEKVQNIKLLVENMLTDHRLEKMIQKMKELGHEIDIKNTGVFLKLVGSDVLAEESDTIVGSGFDRKDVMPTVNYEARQWFMKLLNSELGLL